METREDRGMYAMGTQSLILCCIGYTLWTSKLADDVKMFRAVPIIYKFKQQLGTI